MNALQKKVYFIYSDIAEANPNYPCSMSATPNSICGMQSAYTLLHTYVFDQEMFQAVHLVFVVIILKSEQVEGGSFYI